MKKELLAFLIVPVSLCAMQTAQKTIHLKVGEDIFDVPQLIAMEAETLKHIAEDLGLGEDLPLSAQIDPKTMEQVAQIMWSYSHHKDLKRRVLLDAIEKDVSLYNIPLVTLLQAFNYLDFPVGLALVARAIARNEALSKEFMGNAALKDLRPLVAKYYYLLHGKNLSLIDEHGKNLIDEGSYSFDLQDYIDYQPQFLSSRRSGEDLDLSNMRLHSLEGLGAIAELGDLRELDLYNNQLSVLPTQIFNRLTNLQVLNLKANQLDVLPPELFSNLIALKTLQLDNNRLSILPATVFKSLTNLEWLYLRFNSLRDLPSGIFDTLTNLQGLSLDNNQLNVLIPGTFNNLRRLQWLNLSGNHLRWFPVEILNNLTSLRGLFLFNNELSEENKEELAKRAVPGQRAVGL